ncbi:hypothetical protein HAT86_02765 [Roseovarius gahaiensis]|uniref:Uncharacterized protein n=1 Tax=Roseovarius gahaiensis TaxID=2716691 RepID=A0A967BAV2_9RHOB|nr:hypothetical protein [Roseovarius gahaiensis]NHQ73388.1 hypothetical protein [Roseovarius gahaiensis]
MRWHDGRFAASDGYQDRMACCNRVAFASVGPVRAANPAPWQAGADTLRGAKRKGYQA